MEDNIVDVKKGNNFIVSGAFRYLRYSSHKCEHCILGRKGKCHIYGKTIERDGKKIDVNPSTNCPILADYTDEVVSDIMALPHVETTDVHAVSQVARYLGFLFIANAYLGETGAFIIDGHQLSAKSLHNQIMTVEAALSRALNDLGLTPNSRSKLDMKYRRRKKTLADRVAAMEVQDESK